MKKVRKTEPDLFVINQKPTAEELKALREFVIEYRKKQALLKSNKRRKAA